MSQPHATTTDLLDFIHASPTPQHCVAEAERRLLAAGSTALAEGDVWQLDAQRLYHVPREGSILAFRVGAQPAATAGFRILGAHTDSPNLRVKPVPVVEIAGYRQLGVEVYGGALTYTWLDRDLGLAGVVILQGDGGGPRLERRLLRIDRPLLRVPSLAIHLNREIRTEGLKLNEQAHLSPVLALGDPETPQPEALKQLLAHELDVDAGRVLSWDLCLMDLTPPTLGGAASEFVFSPRLDNQAMCHASLLALLRAGALELPTPATQLICLYDHEEVGSTSASGAAGSFVEDVARRIAEVEGPGAVPGAFSRAIAHSTQVSADMAHAIHPNYADRHEPSHQPRLNAGPVIKINAQRRYATDAEGAGLFESLCREREIPYQKFVNRTDLACGSTIGPISSARIGIRTVDVGNPMLSMHSIREQAGARDPELMVDVMTAFLGS